jgi:multimeric flavodoxin WrbA
MMSKSILILKGSPREKGNSAVLADQVFAGAKDAGAKVESVYLHGMDIQPCDACDVCQEGFEGCIIEDDMQSLYPKITGADAIVISSPIYWCTISAQTKLCIDRWYALESEDWEAFRGKQLGIVLVYGDTDLYTSGGINAIHTFESLARYVGLEIAGMVYGTADQLDDAEKQPKLMQKAFKLGAKLAV